MLNPTARIFPIGRLRLNRAGLPPAILWIPGLLVAAGMVLPIVYLALRTFGAGAEMWDLLIRSRTLEILVRSVLLAAAVSAASMVIAVPLAWLTVRTDLPLRRVWSVVTALPLVIPTYIGGFLVIVALGPRGLLQDLLAPLGVDRLPEIYGFPGAMLTITFLSYPYMLLTVRSALWSLDPSVEEASCSLGHGSWKTFFRVTLPMLRPAIAAGALMVALYTLSDFGAVSLLRYETFTWAIYIQYESAFDRSIAAGLSLVLVVLALGILTMEAFSRGRSRYYRSSAGAPRPPALVRLGRWRWPALIFCGGVVLLSLVLPISILLFWVIRGALEGEQLVFLWGAMGNSLYVSALAAGAAVVAAIPLVMLTVRYPSHMSSLLERVSYVGFALPGIAIALALVFFGANYATPLYQTIVLLVFAYVILFLPTALGSIRTSLLQVSPRVEEAARSLGRTHLQVLLSITVPLVRSGILAGAALVFLLTMKELPATLLLGPLGFDTLATSIWSAASEAFFTRAAASALLLIVVSAIPMAFLMLRDPKRG